MKTAGVSKMSKQTCRWGILSTADIAKKNWQAIWNAENATLAGVASRDKSRASAFIESCQSQRMFDPPPQAFGSYDALIESNDVDAVYVPIPTGLRKEWAIKAARNGKHVLLEKPCSPCAGDLAEIIAACQENHVHFMDGVMLMHGPRIPEMRKLLDDGETVGEIRRICAAVSFQGGDDFVADNIRGKKDLEPQGCLGDLGWYTIRIILWAMNWQMPHSLSARFHRTSSPDKTTAVPLEVSAELYFDDGVTASFYNSFVTHMQQWFVIAGTKGYLRSDDYMLPRVSYEQSFETVKAEFVKFGLDMMMEHYTQRHAFPEYGSGQRNAQETNLIRNFSANVLNGNLETRWADYSLKTQTVLDACMASGAADGSLVELPT